MTTPSDNSERLSGGSRVRKHFAKNSQTATIVASSSSAIVAINNNYCCYTAVKSSESFVAAC